MLIFLLAISFASDNLNERLLVQIDKNHKLEKAKQYILKLIEKQYVKIDDLDEKIEQYAKFNLLNEEEKQQLVNKIKETYYKNHQTESQITNKGLQNKKVDSSPNLRLLKSMKERGKVYDGPSPRGGNRNGDNGREKQRPKED